MEALALLVAAVVVTVAFQAAFRFARPTPVWLGASVLVVAGAMLAVWYDKRGFTDASPYAFALVVIVPSLVSGLIAQLGNGRWRWLVTTVVGAVLAVLSVIPSWIVSCLIAAWFGFRANCRF